MKTRYLSIFSCTIPECLTTRWGDIIIYQITLSKFLSISMLTLNQLYFIIIPNDSLSFSHCYPQKEWAIKTSIITFSCLILFSLLNKKIV